MRRRLLKKMQESKRLSHVSCVTSPFSFNFSDVRLMDNIYGHHISNKVNYDDKVMMICQ